MNEEKLKQIRSFQIRHGIISRSPLIAKIINTILEIAETDISVLLTGESGTGKEVFAQALHNASKRKGNKIIAVNCAAIPESILESELFGHEKGSFTGAQSQRKGYFEMADGGTIFLDEIGEMPPSVQVKLLRVLETREIMRVGSENTTKIDVRVVAATNIPLEKAVAKGKFREDLFYRLNTIRLKLPSLRQRKEDIPMLADFFINSFAKQNDLAQIYGVPTWDGNPNNLVRFPAGERAGLLNRAAYLVNDGTHTSPILRGLKMRRGFLCEDLPDPPQAIADMVRDPAPDHALTTRERFDQKTNIPACIGCHALINPLGYALESYDALGRHRTSEKIYDSAGQLLNDLPLDTVVRPELTLGDPEVSSNATEFNQLVAVNGKAMKCFVTEYFAYSFRKTADLNADGCALEQMRQDLAGQGGSLRNMMLKVPLNKAFRLKSI